jgi:hypothetical protein
LSKVALIILSEVVMNIGPFKISGTPLGLLALGWDIKSGMPLAGNFH